MAELTGGEFYICVSPVEFHDVFHAPDWCFGKIFEIFIDNFLILSAYRFSARKSLTALG